MENSDEMGDQDTAQQEDLHTFLTLGTDGFPSASSEPGYLCGKGRRKKESRPVSNASSGRLNFPNEALSGRRSFRPDFQLFISGEEGFRHDGSIVETFRGRRNCFPRGKGV